MIKLTPPYHKGDGRFFGEIEFYAEEGSDELFDGDVLVNEMGQNIYVTKTEFVEDYFENLWVITGRLMTQDATVPLKETRQLRRMYTAGVDPADPNSSSKSVVIVKSRQTGATWLNKHIQNLKNTKSDSQS